jgi:hypothetical protein
MRVEIAHIKATLPQTSKSEEVKNEIKVGESGDAGEEDTWAKPIESSQKRGRTAKPFTEQTEDDWWGEWATKKSRKG